MSVLNYPAFNEYRIPRKNIMVLSCMDLRLTDNLLDFLQFDNLTNRYDHFILAGASLCTCPEHKDLFDARQLKKYDGFAHWQKSLDDHLGLAVALHQIHDVYIVEHEDCGAYTSFLKNGTFEDLEEEKEAHALFARTLAKRINKATYTETKNGEAHKYKLHVHCFFINLRGEVELLYSTNP